MPKQASIVFKFYQSLLIIGKYTFMENCLLVAVLSISQLIIALIN